MKKKKSTFIMAVLFALGLVSAAVLLVYNLFCPIILPESLTESFGGYTYEHAGETSMPAVENTESIAGSCFSNLSSEKLKTLYLAIEKTVYCIASEQNSDGKYDTMQVSAGTERYSEKEIHMAVTAFFDDNPQVFWCDKSLLCSYSEKKGTYVSAVSLFSADEIDSMSEALAKEALKIISEAPAVSDMYYVEKYVHDKIITQCTYKTPSAESPTASTAYGCIVEKSANCEGITDGFNLLMRCLGIETMKIYGSAQGIGLHTWSCVKLNDSWYMTDVTWDMRENGHRYDYFNMTSDQFLKTHSIEKTYDEAESSADELSLRYYNIFVPVCSDLNQSYFSREGYAVTKESDIYKSKSLLDYIFKSFKSGFGYCCLKISTDRISMEKTVEVLFSEENISYYNTNMQYRLSEGEVFTIHQMNSEISEDMGVIIVRF